MQSNGVDSFAPHTLQAVPVVIEGYNESHEQGTLDESLAALATYPLSRENLILVGSLRRVAA